MSAKDLLLAARHAASIPKQGGLHRIKALDLAFTQGPSGQTHKQVIELAGRIESFVVIEDVPAEIAFDLLSKAFLLAKIGAEVESPFDIARAFLEFISPSSAPIPPSVDSPVA